MEKVSFFENSLKPDEIADMPLDLLLDGIQFGKWQDSILPLRANKSTWDADTYERNKKRLPSFTACGTFSHRSINGLKTHSGVIVMDVDGKDNPTVVESVEAVKESLSRDPYIYSSFVTAGGLGLALMFKINPKKHEESFLGLQNYLFETYGIIIDRSCKDVSRLRFVSFDPYLIRNPAAIKFTKYLPTPPPVLKKLPTAVWVEDDFHKACHEIIQRRLDITGSYQQWYEIGCAISEKMGDRGAEVFDAISQFGPKYNQEKTVRQYDNILRHNGSGITIATFYYYAKQAGISIMSDRTKLIASTAAQAKKGGRKQDSAVKILSEQDGIPEIESLPIIEQVFANNIKVEDETSEIEQVEQWLRQNYSFKRNVILNRPEMNGALMTDLHYRSIWRAAAVVFDKVKKEYLKDIIKSDFAPDYNPFLDFIEKNKESYPDTGKFDNIEKLVECLESNTFDAGTRLYFIFKWLTGFMSTIHGQHSPLMLILVGEKQNTGKTEFFRRLLPAELLDYYAEIPKGQSKDKDDNIRLTQKLLVVDDDMGGRNVKEANVVKGILSTDKFNLRRSYGEDNEDIKRLAIMGGTTNETAVLNDLTGNRRFIPINVLSIDQEKYNSIDKNALFLELYWMYKRGERPNFTDADIQLLKSGTVEFETISPERELLMRYFRIPSEWEIEQKAFSYFTNTEMKAHIERNSLQKIDAKRLGQELKALGFQRIGKKVEGVVTYVYTVVEQRFDALTSPFTG